MPSSYVVRVMQPGLGGDTYLRDRTVVYADSLLEAKVEGAAQLSVSPDAVEVERIQATPSDAELQARQEAYRRNLPQ